MPFAHFLYTRWHIIIINTIDAIPPDIHTHSHAPAWQKNQKIDCTIWIIYQISSLIIVSHIWQMDTQNKKKCCMINQSLCVNCVHPILTTNNWKRLKIVTGQSQADNRLVLVSQNIFTWGCFLVRWNFSFFFTY